jgi:hypothetical protein
MEHDIKHIAENFILEGKLIRSESFGSGHINDTYCLTCERDPILQKDRKMGTQKDRARITSPDVKMVQLLLLFVRRSQTV